MAQNAIDGSIWPSTILQQIVTSLNKPLETAKIKHHYQKVY